MPTPLIGIAGRIGAGKDTIAAHLRDRHGYAILRFSTALKAEVKARFRRTLTVIAGLNGMQPSGREGWSDFLDWLLMVAKPPGIRELLQEYGTEVRRQDDPAYWVNPWSRTYTQHRTRRPEIPVVVPDVRFSNEAHAIAQAGGVIIRVERAALGVYDPMDHASEIGLSRYAYTHVFYNNDTILALTEAVDQWLAARD